MTGVSDATRRRRARTGRSSQSLGVRAEARAIEALAADGWTIVGRRLRTAAGEVDLVATREGLTAFVEVKSRPSLSDAAASLGARQQARLVAAAGLLLAANPDWGLAGVRFDVVLVDQAGRVRRIADAFRDEG